MCQTQYQTVYANRQTHPPSISMVFYEHRSLIYGSRIIFGSTKVVVVDALGTCGPIKINKYLLLLQKSVTYAIGFYPTDPTIHFYAISINGLISKT